MGILNAIFGSGVSKNQVNKMIDDGAMVIDVRTQAEFKGGHVKGSKNIPLQSLHKNIESIKKLNKPVVLCCQSGGRASRALSILKAQGIECENAGSWMDIRNN